MCRKQYNDPVNRKEERKLEVDITAHGKDIAFTIEEVPRGHELRRIDADGDYRRVGVYESIEAAFAGMARHI